MRVAGMAPVDVPGIENVNVSEYVPGHMSYRTAMPKLLSEVGWAVESDEFAEIEDPDPDNHEKRQRELINEIEEARNELESGKKSKWRFGMFRSKKDRVEKKAWETYDDRVKNDANASKDAGKEPEGGVLFDVDAIRAEAVEIATRSEFAAEGFEVRQLESTLPPMKLDLSRANSAATEASAAPPLKTNKSYNDSLRPSDAMEGAAPAETLSRHQTHSPAPEQTYEDWGEYDRKRDPRSGDDEGNVSMSFDTSYTEPAPRMSFDPSPRGSSEPPRPPAKNSPRLPSSREHSLPPTPEASRTAHAPPTPQPQNMNLDHNAWADDPDDDFGKEKEMKMTFE
jgi:hypothetical protein